ncbi:MAG: FAD-dependent oxidoreductase, partial [Leptospira sp.]|nr:FAD-dependent oxidoreductase [Leptospira sp.]
MHKKNTHVVIVGAGFGGLQAIQKLSACEDIEITVIDKTNHHLFQPLLYQVATAVLSPADIAIPSRSLTTDMKNVTVIMGEVNGIDKQNKILFFGHRSLRYDYLILAMGARTSYFGNKNWMKYSMGLKSLSDALKIRKNILLSYEKAELAEDPEEVRALLSYVIIGGGPTGVELAGSLAELSRRIITGDFRNIHPEASQITLIEAGDRLLKSFSEKLSTFTKQ